MSLKKHIPNAITSLNLLCGVIGIICIFDFGRMEVPFIFMLAAVLFDFCDGLAARLLGAYSPIGKELDSLADVVSFGVLPALMMAMVCEFNAEGWMGYLSWIPLLIAVFSALRLAKFNIDERQHESFLGLPTPASALICGSFCCLALYLPESWDKWIPVIVAGISILLCVLLVCELPMFSFKFGKGFKADVITKMKRIAIVSISAIIIVLVVAFKLPLPAIVLGILLAYILENALFWIFGPKEV